MSTIYLRINWKFKLFTGKKINGEAATKNLFRVLKIHFHKACTRLTEALIGHGRLCLGRSATSLMYFVVNVLQIMEKNPGISREVLYRNRNKRAMLALITWSGSRTCPTRSQKILRSVTNTGTVWRFTPLIGAHTNRPPPQTHTHLRWKVCFQHRPTRCNVCRVINNEAEVTVPGRPWKVNQPFLQKKTNPKANRAKMVKTTRQWKWLDRPELDSGKGLPQFLRGKGGKKCKRENTQRRLKQSVQRAEGESRPSQASASKPPRSLNAPQITSNRK